MSRKVLIPIFALLSLVIIVIGVAAAIRLLDSRGMLATGLSRLMDREVRIEGPATLRPGLAPGLRIGDITVAPADGSLLHSAQIGQLDLVFALWPLVRGDFEVHRLVIEDAKVVVVLSAAETDTSEDAPDATGGRYSLRQADLRNLELEIRHDDATPPTLVKLSQLTVDRPDVGPEIELSAAGTIGMLDLDLSGRYDPGAPASAAATAPSLEFEGHLAGASLSASGSLDLSSESPSLALRVRAEAPHLETFSTLAGRELPTVGPVHASGLVEMHGQALGVSDLDVQIGSRDTAWLELTGHVNDITKQREFSLDADFGFDDVRLLGPLVDDPPHIGRIVGKASVHDRAGPPRIEEFTLQGGRPGIFEIDMQGSLDDVDQVHGLDAHLDLKARDLAVLGELLSRDLPTLGPVHASGLVEMHGQALGVSDLDVQIGSRDTAWLELTGHVNDITKQREFSLDADFGFDDVRLLGPLVDDPPHIGRIVGKASVHDRAGPPRIEEFTLQGGRPGIFEIDMQGSLDDVDRMHGLDAHLDLKARDLAVLGELLKRELPPVGPVEFSGAVAAHEGALSTKRFSARLDRTRFKGSVSGEFQPEKRPRITARIEIPTLYLDDIGITPDRRSPQTPRTTASGTRLFSDTPLDLAWTESVDGRFNVRSSRVLGIGGQLLTGLEFDARLEKGRLSLRHVAVDVDGGSTRGSLELDSRASPPARGGKASANGVQLGRAVEQLDFDKAWSGQLDAELDLRSRGASLRALAAGLAGSVVASCGGGTIATAHAGLLTRDVFQSVRNVFGRKKSSEVLNCLLADFEFQQGVGTARALVIDAQDIVILGEGQVDLGRETLAVRLVPRPRRASPFSTAATVQIKGPLRSPDVKTEKTSFLGHTTKAMFKNVESLPGVQQAWDILRGGASDQSPCAKLAGAGR